MSAAIYAIATMDTKGSELNYVANCLRGTGAAVRTVDVGTLSEPVITPDVRREEVLAEASLPAGNDRGGAVSAMSHALCAWLREECALGRVAGVIGIGGSGGTSLICAALRELPIGLPKLMVSTVASGNIAAYVGCSDITMMYSVVDIAGLNSVTRRVLANAAHAVAGMVAYGVSMQRTQARRPPTQPSSKAEAKLTLGLTMFGVTTPCVTAVREQLEAAGHDCLVFHATGAGGRAMEQLVDSGMIDGVLDITTTEVADRIVGGVMAAGEHRFEAMLRRELPWVLSLGAVDMVNFGARETIPNSFRDRKLHIHNSQITLMRTTPDENRQIARWIAAKLNRSTAPLRVLLPEGGVSALDAPGQPFYDPEADRALFEELENCLEQTADRRLIRFPHHINDPAFASALNEHFCAIC